MQNNNLAFLEAYQKAQNFIKTTNVIGIQKEKILHKTIKYYLTPNEEFHEVKIHKSIKGSLFADIYDGKMIYEIQTSGFNKLREKLDVFLAHYEVTIVHPIAYKKYIYKIDEFGLITGPKKSPKTGSIFEVFKELYKIKSFLKNPHLKIKVLLVDLDEYRTITSKKHARSKGYTREVQIPKNLVATIDLNNKGDYIKLLQDLGEKTFNAQIFAKTYHLSLATSRISLNILNYLDAIERIGKKGNSYIYQIKKA